MQQINESEGKGKYCAMANKSNETALPLSLGTISEQRLFVRATGQTIEAPKQIASSMDSYLAFRAIWNREDTINYYESFFMLILNRANGIIAYSKISQGGIAYTAVDNKLILQNVLACNGCSIIVAHNHPSCNIEPSEMDKKVTRKLKDACNVMDVELFDHIILSPANTYFSFADECIL